MPPGTFQMGDTFGDCALHGNPPDFYCTQEGPVHSVTITKGFYLGKYEVTQAQWQTVMGSNPSYFQGCPNCPVEQVSWDDVQIFVSNLNTFTGKTYRLPTEAEWEYAGKGGPLSQGYKYSGSNDPDAVGWYSGSSTQPVGGKMPNELGFYDMSGNVWEWVQDYWAGYGYYAESPPIDPTGPTSGEISNYAHMHRGGSWIYGWDAWNIRSSCRSYGSPVARWENLGFRVAFHPPINQPPVANAGPNQIVEAGSWCNSAVLTLQIRTVLVTL